MEEINWWIDFRIFTKVDPRYLYSYYFDITFITINFFRMPTTVAVLFADDGVYSKQIVSAHQNRLTRVLVTMNYHRTSRV